MQPVDQGLAHHTSRTCSPASCATSHLQVQKTQDEHYNPFVLLLFAGSRCHARDVSLGDLLIPFGTGNTALNIDPRSGAAMPAGCKGRLGSKVPSVAELCSMRPVVHLSVTASYCNAAAAAAAAVVQKGFNCLQHMIIEDNHSCSSSN
jgi:hypothetical protein